MHHRHSDKFIFYCYLGLIVWAPIPLGSNRPWAWGLLQAAVFTLGLAWQYGYMRGRHSVSQAFMKSKYAILLLAAWLAYGLFQLLPVFEEGAILSEYLGSSLSSYPYASFDALLRSAAFAAVFCLTLLLVRNESRLRLLALVIVFSGLFQALYGSLMTLSGIEYGFFYEKTFNLGLATGTFVNRNHYAAYVVLCIAVGIGLLISQLTPHTEFTTTRARIRHWVKLLLSGKTRLRVYLAIMVIAVVLTHSRMGNASLFSSMLIIGTLALLVFKQPPRSLVILLLSLLTIDIFIIGTWFGVERVVERLEQTVQLSEVTGELPDKPRLDVDLYTIDGIRSSPVLGYGGGSYQSAFPQFRQADVHNHYDHAHNDFLELLFEYGAIGGLLLLSFLLGSVAVVIRAMRRSASSLTRGLAFSVAMAICALCFHSAVDFNLYIPAYGFLMSILLAMGWITAYLPQKSSVRTPRKRHRHRASLGILILLSVPVSGLPQVSCNVDSLQIQDTLLDAGFVQRQISQLRAQLKTSKTQDPIRQRMAELTVELALAVEQAELAEKDIVSRQYAKIIAEQLPDTRWRVGNMAKNNQANALLAVATLHRRGILFPKDPKLACDYYQRASHYKLALAMFHTGLCIAEGEPELAVKWMNLAAEAGNSAAQESLGSVCMQMQEPDYPCAVSWFCAAAKQGRLRPTVLAAWIYAEKLDDPEMARPLYYLAANRGDAIAQNNYGELLENLGTPSEKSQAADWYRKSAEAGLGVGQLNLARVLLEDGNATDKSREIAIKWLNLADKQGVTQARKLREWYEAEYDPIR